jgi:diguanylate cyclase (GGDEF)-like protein/PAS domain S-box-containing protein
MKMKFTGRESSTLYRLLADTTSDIILKTDRNGFIVHASPAIERLGIALPGMLIGPHIQDLVHPACAQQIEAQHEAAMAGRNECEWAEYPALTGDRNERWFEIRMRRLEDESGQAYGALGLMRSIEERRAFEEKLFAAVMTDPLTGLSNRGAFIAMLRHMLDEEVGGCLALFSLDHLKAINMKYGQAVGDEALVTFSEVLRGRLRAQDIISRVGGESLGVLLPKASPAQAEAICRRIIAALPQAGRIAGEGSPPITASAGIARISDSLDDTLKRAEMALFHAKATGRNRLEVDGEAKPGRAALRSYS